MNAKRVKSAPLNIYISPELKAAADEAAKAADTTLTALVEHLLGGYCRKHGFLPAEENGKPARSTRR